MVCESYVAVGGVSPLHKAVFLTTHIANDVSECRCAHTDAPISEIPKSKRLYEITLVFTVKAERGREGNTH